ncbi:MAG: hypothetical protein C0397_17205 [Odoribacter sp.]|nr:hypothetical protein [Odoribacter sp.]
MNIIPTYQIGDSVYHICEGSPKGTVVNWKYLCYENIFEYQVTFSHQVSRMWLSENELKTLKNEPDQSH